MNDLTGYNINGLEIYIAKTGEAYSNQNALARMTGVSKQAINQNKRVNAMTTIQAEVLTPVGLRSVHLYNESQILDIVKEYAFKGYAQAQKTLESFGIAGCRVGLYTMAGVKLAPVEQHKALTPAELFLAQAQINVDLERRVDRNEERMDKLEAERDEARARMLALPEPALEVLEKSVRAAINELVRGYGEVAGDYNDCWNYLYRQFTLIYHTDLKKQAANRTKKFEKKVTSLDIAEDLNLLDSLHALAYKLFKVKPLG